MTQEQIFNENEFEDMIEALQDVTYKLEAFYNSEEDRAAVLWQMQQLDKIENLLIYLKDEQENN
jgi:hypothetical protein